ncbi:DUF4179 domain-containing protein [Alkalihalobacillus sp. AL-G]|uniref:DUF4179 domain-containing protein n=1 Tax=Alkalihalobacillus sp. AL-G TaxID=2926399 RepID=UPI00272A3074|nr:DUF4179 domain-containing protein [Alkalihalobacillus sp. AL-G]WLD91724.1 DUF4179 domain-containing protein [Alkalihalobacillus sp. AL-G]
MDEDLKQVKKYYKENYFDEEIATRIKSNVQHRLIKGKKKLSVNKKITYSISAAVLFFTLLFSLAFASPAMARIMSNIPYLNSIFEFIGDRGFQIASEEGLTAQVDKSATDKGITLTINEVYSAGQKISVAYTIQSKEKLIPPSKQSPFQILERPDIVINGKWINHAGSYRHQKVTENKYIGVVEFQTYKQLPDHFDVKINTDSIFNQVGQWTVQFPVKKSTEKEILIAKSKSYKEFTLTANSMAINPAEISITFDHANKVAFKEDGTIIHDEHIGFNLLTDNGTALNLLDLHGYSRPDDLNGNTLVMHNNYIFLPPKRKTDYLILSPYTIPDYKYQEVTGALDAEKFPLTLDKGQLGKVTITDVKYDQNKTLLYFKVKSEFPYPNHLDGARIWLKNVSGEVITTLKRYPDRVKGNLFVLEFKPINEEDKPLKVVTQKHPMPEILEELRIMIPINNN